MRIAPERPIAAFVNLQRLLVLILSSEFLLVSLFVSSQISSVEKKCVLKVININPRKIEIEAKSQNLLYCLPSLQNGLKNFRNVLNIVLLFFNLAVFSIHL
jgi:hypothetical protein